MSAMLAQFHFLRPAWLLLLLALPPALWWLARRSDLPLALARLVDVRLLPHLLDARAAPRRRVLLALPAVAWLLATLALAGPAWERLPQPLYGHRSAQVVALSLSPRMLARDIAPDRLSRARYKVHDLFAANRDGQNALIAYAGEAFVVAPLTSDADALTDLLDALAPDVMPVAGDDAAQAIARGVTLLRQGGADGGSLVLVTDTAGADAVAAARQARKRGVRVSVLGVGSSKGVPVPLADGGFLADAAGKVVLARRDDAALRALAAAGGGRYVPMRADGSDIRALAMQGHAGAGSSTLLRSDVAQWRDRGAWLLLPLLPLAALAFRRGWLLLLLLVFAPLLPPAAHAADPARAASTAVAPSPPSLDERWARLWHTPDQRAARALADHRPRQAQQLARDPALRGAAAYRAGDYAAAARAFAAAGADASYNLGNALARQGHYRQALAAYARALQRDPGNVDAAANRKAVEDWLRRHPPPKPPPPGMQGNGHQDGSGTSTPSNGDAETPHGAKSSTARQPAPQAKGEAEAGQRSPTPYALGDVPAPAASSAKSVPPAMQQALQQVPDDPGGLLRRKFQLEHERREGSGGSP
jgi:Ca-activated chloride channel family protein